MSKVAAKRRASTSTRTGAPKGRRASEAPAAPATMPPPSETRRKVGAAEVAERLDDAGYPPDPVEPGAALSDLDEGIHALGVAILALRGLQHEEVKDDLYSMLFNLRMRLRGVHEALWRKHTPVPPSAEKSRRRANLSPEEIAEQLSDGPTGFDPKPCTPGMVASEMAQMVSLLGAATLAASALPGGELEGSEADDLYSMLFDMRLRLRGIVQALPGRTPAASALENCHAYAEDVLRIDLPKVRSNLTSAVQTLDGLPLKNRLEDRVTAVDLASRELLEAFVTLGSIEQLATAIELDSEVST